MLRKFNNISMHFTMKMMGILLQKWRSRSTTLLQSNSWQSSVRCMRGFTQRMRLQKNVDGVSGANKQCLLDFRS